MSELGITLAWAALQVTLLSLTGSALDLIPPRRPSSAAVPGACLAAVFVLTLVVFCPLPRWWSWGAASVMPAPSAGPRPSNVAAKPEDEQAPRSETRRHGPTSVEDIGAPGSTPLLHSLWANLAARGAPTSGQVGGFARALAFLFLAGSGLCMLRLLGGLWAIDRLRRKSRPVTDAALTALLEDLRRGVGTRRRVMIRECPEMPGAATVGWLRPAVLLPPDWCSWTEAERRAVLAHELAHIRRWDYAAGLVARLSLALHFYHPLVWWLAGRLRLQQELAADALGARLAGGRGPYLQALAQMALRQQARPVAWPARAFLPAPGTLMRRIQMLKERKDGADGNTSRRGRMFAALVATVALGASTLRGPGGSALGEQPDLDVKGSGPVAHPVTKAAAFPAFDLSYCPPDGMGVVAVRPAAAFQTPGLAPFAAKMNAAFADLFKQMGRPERLGPDVQEIEEVLAEVRYIRNEKAPAGSRNAIDILITKMRAAKPFDWNKHLHAFLPDLEEVRHAGKVYYRIPVKSRQLLLLPRIRPGPCLFFPDDRTVVFQSEENVRRWIEKGPDSPPPYLIADAWKEAEHALAAVALDNRDEALVRAIREKRGVEQEPDLYLLFGSEARIVVAFEGLGDFRLRGLARCDSQVKAAAMVRYAEGAVAKARDALRAAEGQDRREIEALAITFGRKAVEGTRIRRDGKEVRWTTEAKINCGDFLTMFLRGFLED